MDVGIVGDAAQLYLRKRLGQALPVAGGPFGQGEEELGEKVIEVKLQCVDCGLVPCARARALR